MSGEICAKVKEQRAQLQLHRQRDIEPSRNTEEMELEQEECGQVLRLFWAFRTMSELETGPDDVAVSIALEDALRYVQ